MNRTHRTDTVWLRLTDTPLDVGEAYAFLPADAAGGIDVFVGTTRRWTDGAETVELTYEAYAPMALQKMQRLAETAAERWPAKRLCLWHRTGTVPVGEASVIVGVASAHRDPAFAACRWLIDTLKAQVPIWKRETYADGTTEWVEGQTPEV
jgi:molybdopterin synthase catalytic subunit